MTATECSNAEIGLLAGPYELGLLSAEQRLAFERHLETCVSCRDALFEMSPYAAAMGENPGRIARGLEVLEAEEPAGGTSGVFSRWLGGLGAVLRGPAWRALVPLGAGAAALIVALILTDTGTEPRIAALAQLDPPGYVPVEMRGGGDPLRLGMSLYVGRRYAEAAEVLLDAMDAPGDLDPNEADAIRIHIGVSRLLSGDAEGAVPVLREAAQSGLPVLSDRATWYLAQARLVRGEGDEARALLQGLAASSPGYGERAARQLDEIASLGD